MPPSDGTARNLPPLPLPEGVVEDYVDCTSTAGLIFHVLKSGEDKNKQKPLVLLFHGFPELAYSWRNLLKGLQNEFFVVAPDHRGYGRTLGWDASSFHHVDLSQFSMTSLVRDYVALTHALGYTEVRAVIGHDFGAMTSSMCALMRPDFFRSCVFMSHPFKEPPSMPFDVTRGPSNKTPTKAEDVQETLAQLPQPRKHYKWYNSTPPAADDWNHPEQGMTAFLRGYFHLKSADWKHNEPFPLKTWTATELAKMPHYYIMRLSESMPQTVASDMLGEDPDATKPWLSDQELDVYVQEWSRTGFQGGLNFYRIGTNPEMSRDLLLFAGKKIEVPSTFISGANDWGNYQEPGVLENLPNACSDFRGVHYIKDAGHWVQQEQPQKTLSAVLDFLHSL